LQLPFSSIIVNKSYMNITKRLLQLDPSLEIHNEGLWNEPYKNDSASFTSFNDAGIECETGEFLYGMTRLLKPDFVLETGTHWGVGASYMGLALQDNNKGQLDTIEFLREIYERAKDRLSKVGVLDTYVKMYLQDVATFKTDKLYKLILLDTEPQTRFAELVSFFPNLEEGGFVFVHDLHRHMHQIPNEEHGFAWPYGEIPEELKSLVKNDLLRPIHFSTPRGLSGFYKTHTNDYKW
jgi:predicted O-methyltransferase YrrM